MRKWKCSYSQASRTKRLSFQHLNCATQETLQLLFPNKKSAWESLFIGTSHNIYIRSICQGFSRLSAERLCDLKKGLISGLFWYIFIFFSLPFVTLFSASLSKFSTFEKRLGLGGSRRHSGWCRCWSSRSFWKLRSDRRGSWNIASPTPYRV